jgi:hypothetical protein
MKKESLFLIANTLTDEIAAAADRINWKDPDNYGNWLAQTFYYVSHSTRVLTAAAARFDTRFDEQHIQLVQHAKEERSHEKIARGDLLALGRKLEDFPEMGATKALYRNAYYLIDRVHPMSIYGYVALLEILSVKRGPALLKEAEEEFGTNCIRYLKLHTEDDVEHIKMYEGLLARCEGEAFEAVKEGLISTAANFQHLLTDIQIAGMTKTNRRAA